MHSRFAVRSILALAAPALAGFAILACSEGSTASSVAGPKTDVTTAGTFVTGSQVDVCIAAGSPAGTYTLTTTAMQPAGGSGAVNNGGTVMVTPGNCATVFDRTAPAVVGPPPSDPQTRVTTTVTAPSGAVISDVDCILDPGTSTPVDCTEAEGGPVEVIVFANAFHGTEVTFTFTQQVVPQPTSGCTVTRGFIRNQLDLLTNGIGNDITPSLIVIAGVPQTNASILEALSTPGKGDPLVQLRAQLITALANIQLGATTNPAVDAAIASAQNLLATNSTDRTAIGAATTTLTSFNEGTAGNGASDHCTDEEEAILKDKASA
ncbi:MAG: hypothetical protein H0U59_11280 [Gemmatimonadaceae bacterium]|nr:hypothetical protein [Gemmatimonadaceae bacterium]MDQ3244501.1 hypothetical protein [Gemmatimonadota bacterium]